MYIQRLGIDCVRKACLFSSTHTFPRTRRHFSSPVSRIEGTRSLLPFLPLPPFTIVFFTFLLIHEFPEESWKEEARETLKRRIPEFHKDLFIEVERSWGREKKKEFLINLANQARSNVSFSLIHERNVKMLYVVGMAGVLGRNARAAAKDWHRLRSCVGRKSWSII